MTRLGRLVASLYVLGLVLGVESQGKKPCHVKDTDPKKNETKAMYFSAPSCKSVTLPPKLCSACRLRLNGITQKGNFKDCSSIYNLQAPGCKEQLEKYVTNNSCDRKRATQVRNWTPKSRKKLDFFVYALCEECCDCIPTSAEQDEFVMRKAAHANEKSDEEDKLFTPLRGNCVSHARFDICTLFPNITSIVAEGVKPIRESERMCDKLKKYIRNLRRTTSQSPIDFDTLPEMPMLGGKIKRFLININNANQCKRRQVWERCVILEKRQGRICSPEGEGMEKCMSDD